MRNSLRDSSAQKRNSPAERPSGANREWSFSFIHWAVYGSRKILPAGGSRGWNTTGIRDGPQVRSYAKVFGQVKLGVKARFELSRSGELTGVAWTASDVVDVNRCRRLALLCRASRAAVAEFFIVTVTESLIGELHMDSWEAQWRRSFHFRSGGPGRR